jgi:hypothetical protein
MYLGHERRTSKNLPKDVSSQDAELELPPEVGPLPSTSDNPSARAFSCPITHQTVYRIVVGDGRPPGILNWSVSAEPPPQSRREWDG